MNTKISHQTKNNWLLDASLLFSALVTSLSGIYFLFAPSSGFQGGRNPYYGVTILFSRQTWEAIHIWSGIVMIVIALVHIAIHWKWIVSMVRRIHRELTRQCNCINPRWRVNLLINTAIGFSLLLSTVSGMYFLFAGSNHGGRTPDPMILFSSATWDAVHTWASVSLIIAAIIHFAIHWRWVVNVTRRVLSIPVRPVLESSQTRSSRAARKLNQTPQTTTNI